MSKTEQNQKNFYNFLGTIKIISTQIDTIDENSIYPVFRSGNRKFVFDKLGKKTFIVKQKVKWIQTDPVVMLVKITGTKLDSIAIEKIYRVFNDETNDERYLIDEQNRKVLFDRTIFNYEII